MSTIWRTRSRIVGQEFDPTPGLDQEIADGGQVGNIEEFRAEQVVPELDDVVFLLDSVGRTDVAAGPVVRQIGPDKHEVTVVKRTDVVADPYLAGCVEDEMDLIFSVIMPYALRPRPGMGEAGEGRFRNG